jgi:hypothetical protein
MIAERMFQLCLIDVGPRTAGATSGMVVRELTSGRIGEIIEVAEAGTPHWYCERIGDVAVQMDVSVRVCGPVSYFWTLFESV